MKKMYLILILTSIIFLLTNLISASNVSLIRNTIWSSNLSGIRHSSLILGDIDNDGDYDMVAMGCSAGGVDTCTTADKIRVYINNGTTFNENLTWESNTTNLGYGSLALGDIDNDGDLDLVTLGDKGSGTGDVQIYTNNGTTFNEDLIWEINLSNIDAYAGSLALGDVDNDGDLDLGFVGADSANENGIYINNGTSFVKNSVWLESLPLVGHGLGMGALSFGDIDNDGYLDLIFAGSYSTNFYDNIYRNNGTSLVGSQVGCDPCGLWGWPSITLGDYDNDRDLDLAYMGTHTGDRFYIYNNTNGNFIQSQLVGSYFDGSIAFGDYDNDGKLDLGAMGKESGGNRIYKNNNTYFEIDNSASIDMQTDNMQQGGLAWFDINGDNNLDLIINGYNPSDGSKNFTVYISNASLTKNNTLPSAPSSGFLSNYSTANNTLILGWGNGSDNETSSNGLYYNLMVGNSTTNHTVVSGVYGGSSNPTAGYFGNMMQRKNITLNLVLAEGIYYWYVQAIDTGLAKSNWSARQSFTVSTDTTKPIISGISSSVTTSTATISWTTDEMANSTVYYGTTTSTTSSSSDASWTMSHSISLSSLSASTTYYYNVSSCDDSGNCNTSSQYSFTTSAAETPPTGGGPSGGGGIITPINKTIPKFDVDFSTETTGTLEAKQGDIKTFSFQGEVKHSITTLAITSNSITLLITSEPITIQLLLGEIKQIDMNNDGINDLEIKLNSIISGKAKFSLTKLEGADIAGKEELGKEALFDVKVNVENWFKVVKSGREVIAKIEVLNVNNIGQVDVLVDYYITDKENDTIAEGSDTLAVEAIASFVRSLTVPYNVKSGVYYFNVDVSYQDELMASGHAEFRVIRNYEIIIAISIIVLIVVGIFFYLWRIRKREERDIGELKSKEKKDIGTLKKKEKKLEQEIKKLKTKKR